MRDLVLKLAVLVELFKAVEAQAFAFSVPLACTQYAASSLLVEVSRAKN